MSAVAFDTYAAVKTLREAGADEAMAEAIVNTASAAVGAGHDALATKADIADTRADVAELRASTKADIVAMKADVAELRASTKADIAELRASTKADIADTRADVAELRASTKADLATLETRLTNALATKVELQATKDDLAAAIASVRGEFGIIRWAVGLNAAFLFVVVVRVFGLI